VTLVLTLTHIVANACSNNPTTSPTQITLATQQTQGYEYELGVHKFDNTSPKRIVSAAMPTQNNHGDMCTQQ
jgi:hypothetical protein